MTDAKNPPSGRIQLIDAVRGLAIVLMVAYHAGYDLVAAELIPEHVLYNPLLNTLEPLFAGLFICLSGVSARYSRDNRKRGLKVLGCALVVSLVTGLVTDTPIYFGILHCLGMCMVLTGEPSGWLDRIPRRWQPVLFGGLFAAAFLLFPVRGEEFVRIPYLYMFGFAAPDFASPDYFPLFPWFFLYPLGAWAGRYIREGRLPQWFYTCRVPVLPALGRRTLLIYMLHQPVLYGAVALIAHLADRG